MSIPALVPTLADLVVEVGSEPFLITASGDGKPHVVSVRLVIDGEAMQVPAGRHTGANVAANPTVTLLWSPVDGADYSLIVDGTAVLVDETTLEVTPTRAVWHKVAGASGDGPSCVTVEATT